MCPVSLLKSLQWVMWTQSFPNATSQGSDVIKSTSIKPTLWDCKNNLKYSLTPWCKHQWKRHTSPYLSRLWRTYLEILSMFAICFWLRMTSMAAHTNWTTLGSACLFFTTRDMISLFITTVGNGGIILKSADFMLLYGCMIPSKQQIVTISDRYCDEIIIFTGKCFLLENFFFLASQ